jgi:GNAT superfamily N-acetyltransferase
MNSTDSGLALVPTPERDEQVMSASGGARRGGFPNGDEREDQLSGRRGVSYASIREARSLPLSVPISEVESARFGLGLGRVELGPDARVDLADLVGLIDESPLDVIVVRYPAAWTDAAAGLTVRGRQAHHADTLLCYGYDPDLADRSSLRALPEGFSVRTAGRLVDTATLERLVRACLEGYSSHYGTNPLLPPKDIVEGYVEWTLRTSAEPGAEVILSFDQQGIGRAFAVVIDGRYPEILLAGVEPEARGRGLYTAMISHACQHSASRSNESLHTSTQAQNLASQQTWLGLGFRLEMVLNTVHLTKIDLVRRGRDLAHPVRRLAHAGEVHAP